jgi:hypothetical protein
MTQPVDYSGMTRTHATEVIDRSPGASGSRGTGTSALPVAGAAGAAAGAGQISATGSPDGRPATQASGLTADDGTGSGSYDDELDRTSERKRRSPWTWPMIGLVALVAFVALGMWLGPMLAGGGGEESSSAPPTSASPSTSASTSPSETSTLPQTVDVVAAQYRGQQIDQVTSALQALGLRVNPVGVEDSSPVGTVLSVSPQGEMPVGTTVTVQFSEGPPAPRPTPTQPTQEPTQEPTPSETQEPTPSETQSEPTQTEPGPTQSEPAQSEPTQTQSAPSSSPPETESPEAHGGVTPGTGPASSQDAGHLS